MLPILVHEFGAITLACFALESVWLFMSAKCNQFQNYRTPVAWAKCYKMKFISEFSWMLLKQMAKWTLEYGHYDVCSQTIAKHNEQNKQRKNITNYTTNTVLFW